MARVLPVLIAFPGKIHSLPRGGMGEGGALKAEEMSHAKVLRLGSKFEREWISRFGWNLWYQSRWFTARAQLPLDATGLIQILSICFLKDSESFWQERHVVGAVLL